ncbi:MAG: hypothetical protein K9G60_03935 [Pseudolabrys sp.]|nr:hypothetical protein [Pseudolabrys sp.]
MAAPRWHYVQARLQARHGARLTEGDWRMLEAAQTLDHFLDRARATPLGRFTDRLNAGMTSHAIERLLRAGWRLYVAEIAGWLGRDWQAAVLWTGLMPDLPALDALRKGETPAWSAHDPLLAPLAEGELQQRMASWENSSLAPLAPGPGREPTIVRRWNAHWQSLWPRRGASQTRPLRKLIAIVADHATQLAAVAPPGTSAPHRLDLARNVTRLFRRYGASPTAVFSHLTLVALDLERLRGDLVRRQQFAPARAREAA